MSRIPESGIAAVVIVSNRGPNDFVWRDGRWVTRSASGGLVSMLTPLARQPSVVWYCCVSEPPDAEQERQGLFTTAADQTDARLDVRPLPLPADLYHAYYGSVSNEVLWMLQHQVIGPDGFDFLDAQRHQDWSKYVEASQRMSSFIAESCPTPGAFLVQDYHLYPLPALLRAQFPATPILHFTHIPFPGPLTLLLLPERWRRTILEGLLGANVVGFQTERDVRSFLRCCEELLGLSVNDRTGVVIAGDGRQVQVRAFAASVDTRALRRTMRSHSVIQARERLARDTWEQTIIRVDRLDPSKNQQVGFLSFARLLEQRPDLRGKVRFQAFLVPSRTDLGIYRKYHDAVYRTIDETNRRFREDCGGSPIVVYYTNDREQALAAMERADVMLINSLHDGMNLVAKEWALVSNRPGVLVVSETAGVSREALGCALAVSPLDVEGTAEALGQALDMEIGEREARLRQFRNRITGWTADDWLRSQLAALKVENTLKPLGTARSQRKSRV